MTLKELITRCTATNPVIIGHSDVNTHGCPTYTVQRFKDPSMVTGPITATYVRSWYMQEGHIMIECSSIPESTDELIGSAYRTGRACTSYEFDDEELGYFRRRLYNGKE